MHDSTTTHETTGQKPSPAEHMPSHSDEPPTTATDSTGNPKPVIDVSKLPRISRRTYVLDRRRQYRTAFLTSGLAAILLIIVNNIAKRLGQSSLW